MKAFVFRHLTLFLLLISASTFAQEAEGEEEDNEEKHTVSFVLSHAKIGQGIDAEGDKQFTSVPSFSLAYNYWIVPKFAIGLHTDFLNENFYVESEKEGDVIERERPIAPAIMGIYNPGKHFSFGLGFGGEFVKGKDYFVTRLAIEYGVEIRNGWEVLGSLTQDFRANIYNVTSLGIGIEKRFGK